MLQQIALVKLLSVNYWLPRNIIEGTRFFKVRTITFGTVMEALMPAANNYIISKVKFSQKLEELDPFKNLATENDFNSPEQHNSSPRRGSAPCNLLINQINANYLRMVANSVPLNGNDRNENEQIISQNQEEDYFEENTTQSSRRGSLPVNLKSYNLNANDTLNNTTEQEFDNCSTTNKEYRLNYAAKRRQMAHCKKLLDRNSSFNDEILPPVGRPPMLSQNASLRSSSFGGIVELLGRALLTRKTCGKLPVTDTICSFRTSIASQVLL